MMATDDSAPDIWAMLEQDAPTGCSALFLDLIGWSEDEIGEPIYRLASANLGYVELAKLASALTEYADRPQDVRAYVDALMAAEAR